MNIRLAIADENEEYMERLLSVLEGYEDLRIFAYTDKRSLEKALAEKHFDVLLFDISVYEGQVSLPKSTLGILLLDDSAEIPKGLGNFPRIKKYQRISRIYQNILELYADICGDIGLPGQRKTRILAFYSPAGGTGKTTMSLAASEKLALQGSKVFYMNLEDIASEGCYLGQSGGKGMSEMLNCLGADTNFQVKMQGLLQTKGENLYYLNHFDKPNDIYEMTAEEEAELIQAIAGTGLFDFIVIDMGLSMDDKALKVFEVADKVAVVEKPDAVSAEKINRFFAQTYIMKEFGDKMVRLLNFDIGRGSMVTANVPLIGRVNMVQNPDAVQFIAMLSQSTAGDFIRAVVEA